MWRGLADGAAFKRFGARSGETAARCSRISARRWARFGRSRLVSSIFLRVSIPPYPYVAELRRGDSIRGDELLLLFDFLFS